MKRILSILLITILVFSLNVSADDLTLIARYDNESKSITCRGATDSAPGDMIMVFIYNNEEREAVTGGETITPVLADAFIQDTLGEYTCEIFLPSDFEAGKYVVRVIAGESSAYDTFMYLDDNAIPSALDAINEASASEMKEVLRAQGPKCSLDPDVYALYADVISDAVYAYKPSGGYKTLEEFVQASNRAIAAAQILDGQDILTVLERYRDILIEYDSDGEIFIDCLEDYKALDDEVKEVFAADIAETDFADKKGFMRAFRQTAVYAQFKCADSYSGVKDVILGQSDGENINNNTEVLGVDLKTYNKLTNKDEVFRNIYRSRSKVGNFDDIVTVFEIECDNCYDDENKKPASSGKGGGGGGGGKTTSVVTSDIPVTPEIIEPKPEAVSFSDMNSHWAKDAVEILCGKGVVNGFADGTFKPEQNVTRSEFAKLICEAFTLSTTGEAPFSDVADGAWYESYVASAYTNGIITGNDKNEFMPDSFITRQDAAVMIYRAILKLGTINEGSSDFVDIAEVSEYARRAVYDLAGAGLISGVGENIFAPLKTTTRAEAATLILNAMEYIDAQ